MTEQSNIPIIPGAPAQLPQPQPVQQGKPYKPKPTWLVLTVAGGIFAVLIAAMALFLPGSPKMDPGPPVPPAINDVTLRCGGDAGIARAEVVVTNRGTVPHYYAVTVEFYDGAGREIASGVALVNDVQPGQSVTDTLVERTDASGDVVAQCRVTHATRA